MIASSPQPVIRPITSANVVENGALIVVAGKSGSGKTCVVENALYCCLDSFTTKNFPPLYVGDDPEFAARYFGKLFSSYQRPTIETMRQAEIWQLGYRQERVDANFHRQGAIYLAAQANKPFVNRVARPRLLFYFDECNTADDLTFAAQCLAPTTDHRAAHSITLLETESMLSLAPLPRPQIIVFTSRLDKERHVNFFTHLLETSRAFAQDLVETANTFIDPCHVALLINLHQWFETEKKRGLFIYEYDVVPPLDEQLKTRRVRNRQHGVQEHHHCHHHRHRHRHRRRREESLVERSKKKL